MLTVCPRSVDSGRSGKAPPDGVRGSDGKRGPAHAKGPRAIAAPERRPTGAARQRAQKRQHVVRLLLRNHGLLRGWPRCRGLHVASLSSLLR